MSSKYLYNVSRFTQQLAQRNAYLRQLKSGQQSDRILLGVITDQLSSVGGEVVVARHQLIKRLEKWAAELHHHISKQKEELSLQYVSQVEVDDQTTEEEAVAQLRRLYSENEEREIEHGTSLIGPQRDDIHFIVNGQNVQRFGSQGQQRTTALAVK